MTSKRPTHAGSHAAGDPQDLPYRVQVGFLLLLAAVYVAGTVRFTGSALLAGVGLALPLISASVAKWLGSTQLGRAEPMAVWGIGGFGLFSLGLTVQFPMELGWTSMLALNVFLTLGAWAVHRIPSRPVALPTFSSIRSSTGFGLAMALAIAVFAIVVVSIGALLGAEDVVVSFRGLSLIVASYAVAGVGGGFSVGVLRPFSSWPVGRMLLGIVVAALAYSAIGIAMLWMGDPEGPTDLRDAVLMGAGIGLIAGPMGALAWTAEHG